MLTISHAVDAGLDFNDLENEDTTIFKMFPSAKHDAKRDQSGAQRGLQNPRTKKSDQSTKFSKINKDLYSDFLAPKRASKSDTFSGKKTSVLKSYSYGSLVTCLAKKAIFCLTCCKLKTGFVQNLEGLF